MKSILEYFEKTVSGSGAACAVEDGERSLTWEELKQCSKRIGSALFDPKRYGKPVPVVMDKGVDTVAAFLGIVYAGCFYVLVNPEHPNVRIEKILETLKADVLLTDAKYEERIKNCGYTGKVVRIEEAKKEEIREKELAEVRRQATDQEPLYGIFTSGSTGTPKGVVVSHRAVADFICCFTELFNITKEDVIGNQAPFDFDVSVKDIYSSIFTGAKLVLIPKHMFSMPPELLDFLCERKVTVLIWAVSALCMVTSLHGFDYRVPTEVKKVLFSGEVMPHKHLRMWQEALPDASFVNLYGPSEIICNCTYYKVGKNEDEAAPLPIGRPFPNRKVFLLDKENREIKKAGEIGEICVAGVSLAFGYYNNPEATAKSFVRNPLNSGYRELIYRTGDLGSYNENGEFCFQGRKDFQIKRMGHRIELEEIQTVMERFGGVDRVCCIYEERENKLFAFYTGCAEKKELRRNMKTQLPRVMIPDAFVQLPQLPLNKNGKINRDELKNRYQKEGA